MKNDKTIYRFVFAAGGTGGHLFPAVAIADRILELKPEAEILFVGTKKKLESTVIPKLGYKFKTLWISGFARSLKLSNLLFPLKLIVSLFQAIKINIKNKPRVAVGAGAYVSGPVLWAAKVLGAKIVLLEQNSFPGVTNRMLEKKADKVFISYEESKKYFRFHDKLVLAGNPVRVLKNKIDKEAAAKKFEIDPSEKTVLIIGGSLGALSINKALEANFEELQSMNIQILWQCGKNYFDEFKKFNSEKIRVFPFIEDMAAAYSASDIVLARAGATTIAEISSLGLASILVPSPNVAADHQTKNAQALIDKNAAVMIKDSELSEKIIPSIKDLLNDENKIEDLKNKVKQFSVENSAEIIAVEIIKMAETV